MKQKNTIPCPLCKTSISKRYVVYC